MKNKDYFIERGLPLKQYYDQFETARKLEVGKVYYRNSGIFWEHIKIIFVGSGIAVGEVVSNGNNNFCLGNKVMFYSEGNASGWQYQDQRPCYRLLRETNNV